MITLSLPMFSNSIKLLQLHWEGKAKPIGRSKANETTQWVATDTKQKVVEIGKLLREDIRP